MEFVTPPQPHQISVSISIQFDNSEPFPIPPDMHMFNYVVDPTVSTVDPKTAIIRLDWFYVCCLCHLMRRQPD